MLKLLWRWRWSLLASACIGTAGLFIRDEMAALPELPQVRFWQPAIGSKLLDRSGKVIFEYAVEKRDYAPLQDIPLVLRNAVIAIEDDRFWLHWGIDLRAIFRAVWTNFLHGRVVQGGSTITQQLAKNLFLTRERSLRRKFRELLLSIYIEANFSKDEILEMYLNQVYLGHGVYGFGQGASAFFQKDLRELNVAQAAFLAGLIKAPANYSPWKNPKAGVKRSHLVLRRMAETGYISTATFAAAAAQDLEITTRSASALPAAFAHFIEYVRQDVEQRYSTDLLWKGGLQIETTLDANQQERVFAVVSRAMDRFDVQRREWEARRGNAAFSTSTLRIEGSFLALDVQSGETLVWIGGRDFRASQFNRVYQSKRQPGSAFKPFVWHAAISAGASPASIYEDLPLAYTYDGKRWRLVEGSTDFYRILQATAALPTEMAWVPNNFDGKYMNRMTLRRALALSRNLISIRLVDQVGPNLVVATARRAGIESRLDRVLSLGLGTAEVTLLELVGAYQTLANIGVHAKPYAIRKIIQTATGSVLEENHPQLSEALDSRETFLTVEMMKSVTTEGTARHAGRRIPRPLAGKTGTGQENRDLWFVGFTPDIVAGGWMGYDNFESLGRRDITGGSTVVPWWTEAVLPMMTARPLRDFGPPPDGIVYAKICAVSGKLWRSGCPKARLEAFLKENQPSEFCDLDSHEQEVLVRPVNLELPAAPDVEASTAPSVPIPAGEPVVKELEQEDMEPTHEQGLEN